MKYRMQQHAVISSGPPTYYKKGNSKTVSPKLNNCSVQ